MRDDMAKVVTERPRRGHANKSLKTRKRLHRSEFELDDVGPNVAPVSRHRQHGYMAKEFSDLLGPLRKYLKSQTGRPWNKVFSELSQKLDRRSMAGEHIWSHVKSEVETNCFMYEGKVWVWPRYGFGDPHQPDGLYVHPNDGLLKWSDYKRYRAFRPKPDPDVFQIDSKTTLRKVDGIWYRFTFVGVKQGFKHFDPVSGKHKWSTYGDINVYEKRQLSHRELREAKLENTIKEDA